MRKKIIITILLTVLWILENSNLTLLANFFAILVITLVWSKLLD